MIITVEDIYQLARTNTTLHAALSYAYQEDLDILPTMMLAVSELTKRNKVLEELIEDAVRNSQLPTFRIEEIRGKIGGGD